MFGHSSSTKSLPLLCLVYFNMLESNILHAITGKCVLIKLSLPQARLQQYIKIKIDLTISWHIFDHTCMTLVLQCMETGKSKQVEPPLLKCYSFFGRRRRRSIVLTCLHSFVQIVIQRDTWSSESRRTLSPLLSPAHPIRRFSAWKLFGTIAL